MLTKHRMLLLFGLLMAICVLGTSGSAVGLTNNTTDPILVAAGATELEDVPAHLRFAGRVAANDTSAQPCIRVTYVSPWPSSVYLPVVQGNSDGLAPAPSTGPVIVQVTQDTDGCLKFVGDTIHFTLDVGEAGGLAMVDIGDVHSSLQLYDDGTRGDTVADDGVYQLDYVTKASDVVRTARVTGHFTSSNGVSAPKKHASGYITIADWEAGEASVAPVEQITEDPENGLRYAADRLVIGAAETASHTDIVTILAENELILASWVPRLGLYEVQLADGYETVSTTLIGLPEIEAVGRNHILDQLGAPIQIHDQLMPKFQSHNLNLIRASLGWEITIGKPDVKVAVIDTGVDGTHQDLESQIESIELCLLCSPGDRNGHGTAVSGIIAAENGNVGMSGVAPGIKLNFYKPLRTNNMIAAHYVSQAADDGAAVINMSFGDKTYEVGIDIWILKRGIDYAYNKDVVLIAAAGNSGLQSLWPASFDEVLAVGATNAEDARAVTSEWSSNYGADVVFAPAQAIVSAMPGDAYGLVGGTSHAAPQVSALAALLLSIDDTLSNVDVVNIITRTTDLTRTQTGDPIGGLGRINVYRALMLTSTGHDPGFDDLPPAPTDLEATVMDGDVYLSWTSLSEDYAGAHIYRFEVDPDDDDDITQIVRTDLLEGGIVGGAEYLDQTAERGKTYHYRVFSVDVLGQESVGHAGTEMPISLPPKMSEEMITIPVGEFQMGCDRSNSNEVYCNYWEQPLHTVYLDEYVIGKYEVTNAQYAEFLNAEGNQEEGGVTWLEDDSGYVRIHKHDGVWQADAGYEDHPVVEVSWYGARAYAEWVGGRLPTEAEWEKAARGSNDTRKYPWGNEDPDCSRLNYDNCVGDTMPVGSYPSGASLYGVMDMTGNVVEWVNDRYNAYYYKVSSYRNPMGPASGNRRVLRGGDFDDPARLVRCAHRGWGYPDGRSWHLGFRVVVSPSSRTE